ncbi:hypothetical protein ACF0H5_014694 [Mactra antiquata]
MTEPLEEMIINGEDEVTKLKTKLSSINLLSESTRIDRSENTESITCKILREKCKLMESQIRQFDERKLNALPDDIDIQYAVLKDNLIKRIQQHKECSSFLEMHKKETQELLERELTINEELKAVVTSIEMKLQETEQEKYSKSEVLKRLEAKCSTVDKINKQRWNDMCTFLDEHYPLPDVAAFSKVKTKLCDGEEHSLMNLQDLLPLKLIVKELMKACIDRPNDPYIVIDHRYWPPYVDLLVQCDIALRHPEHSGRIKLMPFHL